MYGFINNIFNSFGGGEMGILFIKKLGAIAKKSCLFTY